MASGDLLAAFECPQGFPPETSPALIYMADGGSSPPEKMLCWAFPDGADYYVDFYLTIPENYDDGGVTITIEIEDISTTDGMVPRVAWRRLELTDTFTSSHTYDYNQTTVTGTGNAGRGLTGQITFTTGTDMDSVTGGDYAILRLHRNYTDGNDDYAGDMRVRRIVIEET